MRNVIVSATPKIDSMVIIMRITVLSNATHTQIIDEIGAKTQELSDT